MPTFDVDREQINVFEVDDFFAFKHYFEFDEAFNEVREYYNGDKYRFEVPKDELDPVRGILTDHHYDLNVVDNVEKFCVAKRKYSDHPDLLFRNAVLQRSIGDYNVFLLKDQLAVEQAVFHMAEPLSKADIDVSEMPFMSVKRT